jgi:hypothetical protein
VKPLLTPVAGIYEFLEKNLAVLGMSCCFVKDKNIVEKNKQSSSQYLTISFIETIKKMYL